MNWPYTHRWEFVVFAGGWAAYTCQDCGVTGYGTCRWQSLFVPCAPTQSGEGG